MSSVFSAISGLRPGAVAVAAAGLVVAGLPAAAQAAGPAHAAGSGRATATAAEVRLDVGLLNRTVDVPVDVSLNKVSAPGQGGGTMLTARVDGVAQGAPITLVKAQLGTARATVDRKGARASVRLVGADVHVPGLPLTALLGLEAVTAAVDCPVDGRPTAEADVLGTLRVLGRRVTLTAAGPTRVAVPGVGVVSAELSRRAVTSTTAAATALELDVTVNPLKLNVARVAGRVTVASVSCVRPGAADTSTTTTAPSAQPPATASAPATAPSSAAPSGSAAPSASASAAPNAPRTTDADLAETGGSVSPLLLGGAAVLVVVGAGALLVVRRRRGSV
ncbi:SCO1860 family LAETG-anchored protein [Peterkaempfera griseoplana]|uniref:SCO1860 family LAETG-anchored protein n=1 Tax=Peterkaempfera griseoplana TaxID=66896 RepID=UPI0006E3D590|nr:SCO1860 family LAETG-anchored protein [Peterkaempfera griseoplana]